MKYVKLGKTGLTVPAVAIGCMRLTGLEPEDAEKFLKTAIENGANFFDHADIYGGGECERLFSKALNMSPSVREKVIIQSKCAIKKGMYDFSKEHILSSVDKILQRLNTEYLDVLLLHRPDALCEPEEVAEAFDVLKTSGKVRHFGVSNHNPMQIMLLEKHLNVPINVNQLQFSVTNCTMISNGINVNMENDSAVCCDGSVLDFCRLNDITIQPWSPFQYGFFEGTYIGNPKFEKLNECLEKTGKAYGVSSTCIALAWILRHPANMQPIIGTMNIQRMLDCIKACDIKLSREEWYEIYTSAGNILP